MSLSKQLSKMEENMWAIIDKYKEKLSLAATHEQRLEDEYAKVSVLQAEREARERVIDSLHKEENTVVLKRVWLGFSLDSSLAPAVILFQTHDSETASSNRRWMKAEKP